MPALTMRMYTMAKKVVMPAMISVRMVEPAAVMPKNLSSPAAFLLLVTVDSSLFHFPLRLQRRRKAAGLLYHIPRQKAICL